MGINIEATPNPAAMKFTVGVPVGGPATYTDPSEAAEPFTSILAVEGVASAFATADFVTVTKKPEADWDAVSPAIVEILDGAFG